MGGADVFSDMLLRWLPTDFTCFLVHYHFFVSQVQFSVKFSERDGHGVRVVVLGGYFSRIIFVFQNTHAVVFKNNFVFVLVGYGWIL